MKFSKVKDIWNSLIIRFYEFLIIKPIKDDKVVIYEIASEGANSLYMTQKHADHVYQVMAATEDYAKDNKEKLRDPAALEIYYHTKNSKNLI